MLEGNAGTIITFYYYLEAQPTTIKVSWGKEFIVNNKVGYLE